MHLGSESDRRHSGLGLCLQVLKALTGGLQMKGLWLTVRTASLVLLVGTQTSVAQEFPLITGTSRSPTGWDDGQMEFRVVNPNNPTVRKSVVVRFAGESGNNLTSLTMVTPDWTLDLTTYARGLFWPFPNRIRLSMGFLAESGKIPDVSLGLPYFVRPPEFPDQIERWRCTELTLLIREGRVVSQATSVPERARCDF